MTPRSLSLPLSNYSRALASRSALVSLLGLSFVVGLGVAASNPGVIGVFLDLLAISFLLLCPVCAKGSGNRAVLTLGAVTGVAAVAGLLSKLMIASGSSAWFGDAAWGAIQVALVKLANNTSKINTDSSGALTVAAAL